MKRITWTIGVQKEQGDVIADGILHYNPPNFVRLNGTLLNPETDYVFTPDVYDGNYSDVLGYLDFTNIGGLVDTMKLELIW